jgi:hypothetical protein
VLLQELEGPCLNWLKALYSYNMKRFSIPLAMALTLSLTAPAHAAVKSATKPSAPTITSVTNGPVKKGKVNITVTFTLPANLGGAAIKQTKVSAGGKSCTAKKSKTSCTIKGLKNGKVVNVSARSQNKKGYGPKSAAVSHQAGSGVAVASKETKGQSNARKSAASYLSFMTFSRSGLIKQLQFEGFSIGESTYGADVQGVDWNAQATKSAASYLSLTSFSRSSLIAQLEFEGFTNEQASFGAAANGFPDAKGAAASYLNLMAFSRSGLIKQLQFEGFSLEESTTGVDAQGADWNAQAAKSAASYLRISSFTRASLISQLEFEGFTNEQAVAGVTANGY